MNDCGNRTKQQINWLMNIEKRPFTLNNHYYSDYKDKFMSYYRGCRQKYGESQLTKNLQGYKPYTPNNYTSATPFQNGMTQVIANLPQVGITGVQPVDLVRLLPPDPMEPALSIMAGVRAYFQGSEACGSRFFALLKVNLFSCVQTIHG